MKRDKKQPKRGIVLLVVVSLLTLFILLGITYAIVATQYKEAGQQAARHNVYGDEPATEFDLVLSQLLFDTLVRTSLQHHSLLGDLYGNDGVAAKVTTATAVTSPANSGLITLDLGTSGVTQPFGGSLSDVYDYYNGRVLTFLDGDAAKVSTRIMHYSPQSGGTGRVIIETAEGVSASNLANSIVLINGAPLNGTGFGYDTGARNLEAKDSTFNQLVALMPHFAGYANPTSLATQGGQDESWDAVDYQNMVLAMDPPNSTSNSLLPILPSFHRPELVYYWYTQANNLWDSTTNAYTSSDQDDYRDFRRQFIFRPMPWDHPKFTGSNSAFSVPGWLPGPDGKPGVANEDDDGDGTVDNNTELGSPYSDDIPNNESNLLSSLRNGPWDVDNDADGRADSIWIDPGLPVLTAPNGRRYKRLVAIMVKDLDGRVNVNAHGNSQIAGNTNYRAETQVPATNLAGKAANAMAAGQVHVARGLGFGPAEVDFQNIFSIAGDSSPQGSYQSFLNQRYGANALPGADSSDDTLSQYKQIGVPSDHTTTRSSYATPPDVWGRSAMALDYFGQPVWAYAGTSDQRTDDPYEMQVDPLTARTDNPFTISELERLLRYYDADAPMISSRLAITSLGNSRRARETLTTASWSIAAPSTIIPREARTESWTGGPIQKNILDLYEHEFGGVPTQNVWAKIVPFEIRHGEKLNINRLLGDGQDYSAAMVPGNGVVDEPGEANSNSNYDFINDVPETLTSNLPRQLLARHLYCLMMLVRNTGYNYDTDGDGTATKAETARLLAQWAVNVVDFRDPDSIMTPFVYDIDPFDSTGWDVPNDPPSNLDPSIGGVVWGCERPELLITETLAWHDRRTEDTKDDTPEQKLTTDTVDPDEDFDQRLRPVGAFFVELFNPWFDRSGSSYDHKPNELYRGTEGVALNATTPSGGSPVWRLAIVRDTAKDDNPDHPRPESLTSGTELERSVYFTDVSASAPGNGGTAYYTDLTVAPVKPGRYAMIGSSGIASAAMNPSYTSYVGRKIGDTNSNLANLDSTRRLVLTPSSNPDTNQFTVSDNGSTTWDKAGTNDVQPVVAIPINRPRSLSITEPVDGYTGTGFVAPPPTPIADSTGVYEPPLDRPLDRGRGGEFDALNVDGTLEDFRRVHLQRLANPLIAWHALTNPYITIDSSSVDVTSFNGVTNDNDPSTMGSGTVNFQTFQRGGSFSSAADGVGGYPEPPVGTPIRNLWKREAKRGAPSGSSPTEATAGHYHNYTLFHTLGYLNRRYHPYLTFADFGAYSQYVGAPHYQDGMSTAPAFPWLTFNDRPYMNPMELMLVPCRSQFDLLQYYRVTSTSMPGASPYDNGNVTEPFGHLLNFFQGPVDATINTGTQLGPQLQRLFDYVETPSPFVETERWYPASSFNSTSAPSPSAAVTYRPPFNRLSRHRDPGKININTIFPDALDSSPVFESALKGMRRMDPSVDSSLLSAVIRSRQGYGTAAYEANPNYPSYFSQPFRSADSADMMPPIGGTPPILRKKGIDATLLRKHPDNNNPLFANFATEEYEDSYRNPYFRYQGLQKIGNIFSTHSNVYAVWMTMGYFEVEAGKVDPGHPDGYLLGQELGADSGEIQRHRAFFIIDRSIPVAYQPGMRHNTDKAVLLRRVIE